MEVMVPVRHLDMDFDFNSARASPCVTAPSTPRGFGDYYLSAPPSPSHLSQLYRDFDDFLIDDDGDGDGDGEGKSAAAYGVPFSWEEKPGKPKKREDVFDFAFDVGEECETASLSAEELFDGGMIKPLEPPPHSGYGGRRKMSKIGAFSPRNKRKSESFALADEVVRRTPERERRGRERVSSLQSSSRRATRSVSPLRVSQYPWEEEQEKQQQDSAKPPQPSSSLSSSSSSKGLVKKWRLKDFFLFRSASEGRASDKDHLKKYTAAVVKGSSFRGGNDSGSHSGSLSRRRRGPISAHELHYTFNKAISEDLKKKTFLPYKQGILGKLAFNPAVHAVANGFGLSRK